MVNMKPIAVGKTYFLNLLRQIRQSLGRFFAIFAIVMVGVGFLAGLLAATPDMKASVDNYYDRQQMADVFIKATKGLTDTDLNTLRSRNEIKAVTPARVTDIPARVGNENITARIYGLPIKEIQVNILELKSGRMPQNENECVAEQGGGYLSNLAIGTVLTVPQEKTLLKTKELVVVGTVANPFYFSMERETSNVGNGRIGTIIYTDQSCFDLDIYTDFFITLKTFDNLTAFTKRYENDVKKVIETLESIGYERSALRYQEIIDAANKELEKARTEYEEGKTKAENELVKARKELDDGLAKINLSQKELSDAKTSLQEGKAKLQKERSDYAIRMIEEEQKIKDGENAIAQAKVDLAALKVKLDAAQPQVEQAKTLLKQGVVLPEEVLEQIRQYDEGVLTYQAGLAQVSSQETKLKTGKEELEAVKAEAELELANAEKQLTRAQQKIDSGETELTKAKADLAAGEAKYKKSKEETEQKLSDAQVKISDAEKEISEIETPKWFVLDRSANAGYVSFSANADKVAAIATVFPVFFILVAALVALTTMTRMVEEERTQIGTLKALGYTKSAIMLKYILYCGTASLTGCITGLLIGFSLLPNILWKAYELMYHLPVLKTPFHWLFAVIATAIAVLSTLAATISACYQALKEKPAALMLPRAPKAGKRILLEHIGFIWSKLKFTYKAIARNLFRYKKHFIMTIIGIAGCTALILTGFGLKDSVNSIIKTQFDELIHYDLTIELNQEAHSEDLNMFLSENTLSYSTFNSQIIKVSQNNQNINAMLYVTKDSSQMGQSFNLINRKTGKVLVFDNTSVIMTEKLAQTLDLKIGDAFTLENADGEAAQFTLLGVCENYVGSSVYIGPQRYTEAFGVPKYTTLLAKTQITEPIQQDKALETLLNIHSVSGADFITPLRKSFTNLLSTIYFLVTVLILAAGALAVIVLYNLTNINIEERKKELATLKVLGFYNEDVAKYIYRETAILSLIGTAVGLGLGVLLHSFVIHIADTTDMMFGRTIAFSSFALSAVITFLFTVLVDLFMYRKLKKIRMADSMKAVD